jgi:purine-nucleoside phosphorylase
MIQAIEETAAFLQSKGILNPMIGIVLGTGLNALASQMNVEVEISYHEIPNFVPATVVQHKGCLLYGSIAGKKVLLMQGRLHSYEGHNFQQVTFPIRVMKWLGVQMLLLSNAAGGLNLTYRQGDLMLLTDHLNLQRSNPLVGKHYEDFGARFPDMSQVYSPLLNEKIAAIAIAQNIGLHQGVYLAVNGPNIETKAEVRFMRMMGADVVGMSTVPEAIVAHQMGVACAAISVITNESDPDHMKPVDIEEIMTAAQSADGRLARLYTQIISEL